MKFLDKVKNMFTEEVEEEQPTNEVKVEQIVPEPRKENKIADEFEEIREKEIKKEEKKPVFFTDDDFNDLDNYFKKEKEEKVIVEEKKDKVRSNEVSINKSSRLNDYDPVKSAGDYLNKYNEEEKVPYQGNTVEEKKTTKFKPTPIISPVYGILDKNYHKEDIVNKKDNNFKTNDYSSVDSVRDKAYGTLEDELENTLFGSNSILFNEKDKKIENKDDDLDFFDDLEQETSLDKPNEDLRDLENITMDIGKELDTLLNKDKKSDTDSDDDLFNLIDTMYDGDDNYDN